MKKQILYIGNALSHKGANVTSIETLGNFLKAEGYEVIKASSQRNKLLRLLDMLYSVHRYRKTASYVLIDTYSTTNFWYAVWVGRLCRFYALKYIPILRGGDLPKRIKKSKSPSRSLFENAHLNIAPSAYLIDAFNKEGYTGIKYIPNTIDITNYPYKQRDQVAPKLLWVRSFSTIYNPLMALKVLQQLLSSYPQAQLCMVGPAKDESYEMCTAFAKANQLPVTFTGKLSKQEWIALAADYDIFINTTDYDNTPVSVIEAMALGLPIVSTDVGGIPFLIKNQEEGLLSEKKNVQDFVKHIELLINNTDLNIYISKNARAMTEKFDWEVVKQDWNAVLS